MARNKEQNEKMKAERKEQILIGALHVFSDKGFAATKISDISSTVGMSQGLLYHYYSSKEDIYFDLISTSFEQISEMLTHIEELSLSSNEKIKIALRQLSLAIELNDNFYRYFLLSAQSHCPQMLTSEQLEQLNQKRALPVKIIERMITTGQQEGKITDGNPSDMTTFFWATIKGLALQRAHQGIHYRTPDINIFLRLFIPANLIQQ